MSDSRGRTNIFPPLFTCAICGPQDKRDLEDIANTDTKKNTQGTTLKTNSVCATQVCTGIMLYANLLILSVSKWQTIQYNTILFDCSIVFHWVWWSRRCDEVPERHVISPQVEWLTCPFPLYCPYPRRQKSSWMDLPPWRWSSRGSGWRSCGTQSSTSTARRNAVPDSGERPAPNTLT